MTRPTVKRILDYLREACGVGQQVEENGDTFAWDIELIDLLNKLEHNNMDWNGDE